MNSQFSNGDLDERKLLVKTRNDSSSSSSSSLPLNGGYGNLQNSRTTDTPGMSTLFTSGDWQLDIDDVIHEMCGLNGLIVLGLVVLLMYILLAKSYDVSFWFVIVISSIFVIFYLYWVCIRSPSQYYAQINSVTASYYQARASQSNTPGGEPEKLETTDDIINTTTYQAAPAFGRGSVLGRGGGNQEGGSPGPMNFLI
jgi:hypothetical protein